MPRWRQVCDAKVRVFSREVTVLHAMSTAQDCLPSPDPSASQR
jgi:hypothetical protein